MRLFCFLCLYIHRRRTSNGLQFIYAAWNSIASCFTHKCARRNANQTQLTTKLRERTEQKNIARIHTSLSSSLLLLLWIIINFNGIYIYGYICICTFVCHIWTNNSIASTEHWHQCDYILMVLVLSFCALRLPIHFPEPLWSISNIVFGQQHSWSFLFFHSLCI